VGFELAGAHVRYRASIASIPRPSTHAVRAWGDDSIDAIADCYRRVASAGNGPIDRPRWWWKERTLGSWEPQEEMIHRYAAYDGDRVDGYLVFTQERGSGEAQWRYSLMCRDLFWASPAAARSLLTFAAGHRSLALDLVWVGSIEEPLRAFFIEQDARLERSFHWMMRIVDPAAALEARGYPRPVEGAVEIEVADPVVRANCGALRLELEEGRARVRRVERAAARIGVGTLAALYSGWLTPADAARSGGLVGAGEREIELLTAAFAGPKPWMSDFF
jgi:predicted acetyltransferase